MPTNKSAGYIDFSPITIHEIKQNVKFLDNPDKQVPTIQISQAHLELSAA